MATCSEHTCTPVQLQKLFFLPDKRAAAALGGPHFNFQPYHCGPFGKTVYDELEQLESEGKVEILRDRDLRLRKYRIYGKRSANYRPVPWVDAQNLFPK